jgi:ankyrin repeat protein
VVDVLRFKFGLKPIESDHRGRTLLHWAAEHSWSISDEQVLEFSCGDVNKGDRDGSTALHIAIRERNTLLARQLMHAGARILVRNKWKQTPAHIAAPSGYRRALHIFLDCSIREFGRTQEGASLLHLMSAWFEGTMLRRFIIEKHPLVNVRDNHRRTPLHYAATTDNVTGIEVLVLYGANIHAKDDAERTPLHDSIRGLSPNATRCLLRLKAKKAGVDGFGQTLLHLACRYGDSDLALDLIKIQVNLNRVDKSGKTALHRACENGNLPVVEKLVREGATMLVMDKYQISPLDLAIRGGFRETIAFLLQMIGAQKSRQQETGLILNNAVASAVESSRRKLLMAMGREEDRPTPILRALRNLGATIDPLQFKEPVYPEEIRDEEYIEARSLVPGSHWTPYTESGPSTTPGDRPFTDKRDKYPPMPDAARSERARGRRPRPGRPRAGAESASDASGNDGGDEEERLRQTVRQCRHDLDRATRRMERARKAVIDAGVALDEADSRLQLFQKGRGKRRMPRTS